jgi:hypothetical protein
MLSVWLQGKGLLGFVSSAVGQTACRLEVIFLDAQTKKQVPSIKLKAQGKHPAEELPLYVINDATRICGEVGSPTGAFV